MFQPITLEYEAFLAQQFPTLSIPVEHQAMLRWLARQQRTSKKRLYPSQKRLFNWCKNELKYRAAKQIDRAWHPPPTWGQEPRVELAQIRALREELK